MGLEGSGGEWRAVEGEWRVVERIERGVNVILPQGRDKRMEREFRPTQHNHHC